jgi:hypothetical protein
VAGAGYRVSGYHPVISPPVGKYNSFSSLPQQFAFSFSNVYIFVGVKQRLCLIVIGKAFANELI